MRIKINKNNTIVKIIIGIVFALFILASMEILLRFTKFNYDFPLFELQFVGHPLVDEYEFKIIETDVFEPCDTYFWRLKKNTSQSNSVGFRGKKEYKIIKPENTLRIITLGNSCTCNIFKDENYPALLENILQKINPSKNIEVINAGVNGYSSFQGLKYLKNDLLKYSPDIVTVKLVWNNHWLAYPVQDKYAYAPHPILFKLRLLKKLKIYNFFKKFFINYTYKPVFRVPLDEYKNNMLEFIALSKKYNFKLIFLTAPTAWSDYPEYYNFDLNNTDGYQNLDIAVIHYIYNELLKKIADENNIDLLDLCPLLNHKKEVYESDGIHFFKDADQIIADALAKFINKLNFLSN